VQFGFVDGKTIGNILVALHRVIGSPIEISNSLEVTEQIPFTPKGN
jgi:hypothetical protein